MSKKNLNLYVKVPAIEIKLAEKDGVPKKVQLLRVGMFNHPEHGNIPITKETLKKMQQNFSDKVRGIDLSIDYAHEADKEAAAWIKNVMLDESGNELWAEVDWTPKGEEKIKGKEYKYISADFNFNYVDNETQKKYGATLFGAGLTNRPFVKNMNPIQLNEVVNQKPGAMTMNPEELKAENEMLKKKIAELEAKISGGDSAAKMADMQKKLEDYAAKDKAAMEEKKLSEKKAKFDKLLSEGKTVEAQRDAFMSDDMVKFTELASNVNLSEKGNAGKGVEETIKLKEGEDVQDKVIELANKAVAEKKAKDFDAGLHLVFSEHPDLEKKYNSTFGR